MKKYLKNLKLCVNSHEDLGAKLQTLTNRRDATLETFGKAFMTIRHSKLEVIPFSHRVTDWASNNPSTPNTLVFRLTRTGLVLCNILE